MSIAFLNTVFKGRDRITEDIIFCVNQNQNYIYETGIEKRFKNSATYYYTGSVIPQEGRPQRRLKDTKKAYVVVFDDIGTKVGEPPIQPTYKLETSEDNFQWGYRLNPTKNLNAVKALIEAAVRAEWTDPGAKGACRLVRMPGSLHRSGFIAKVTEWNSDVILDIEDFGLDLVAPDKNIPDIGDVDDPLFHWLNEHYGFHPDDGRDFRHMLVCPWGERHTKEQKRTDTGYSPLGSGSNPLTRSFKCLHACEETIKDILALPGCPVDTAIIAANGNPNETKKTLNVIYEQLLPFMKYTQRGTPKEKQQNSIENVKAVIDYVGYPIRLNQMTKEIEGLDYVDCEDYCKAAQLESTGLTDRYNIIAEKEGYHPVRDWIDSKPWDGVSRLDELCTTVPVSKPELFRKTLPIWLRQNVRATDEGGQVEHVLVLVGPGGTYKSTWFERLLKDVPNAFLGEANVPRAGVNVDGIMALTGHLMVELSELDGVYKHADTASFKSFLSKTTDKYRPPYGRKVLSYPRRTVFCATSNTHDLLRDHTGNRRFWVFTVTERIKSRHKIDMQQVFAEVKATVSEQMEITIAAELDAVTQDHMFYTTTQMALDEYLNDIMDNPTTTAAVSVMDITRAIGSSKHPVSGHEVLTFLTPRFGQHSGNTWAKAKMNKKRKSWVLDVNEYVYTSLTLEKHF